MSVLRLALGKALREPAFVRTCDSPKPGPGILVYEIPVRVFRLRIAAPVDVRRVFRDLRL